jgi:hypothetical protein
MQFDRRWAVPASVFVAAQFFGAVIMSAHLGYRQMPPFRYYGMIFMDACLAAFAITVAVGFARAIQARSPAPTLYLSNWLRGHWPKLPELVLGLFLCWLQLVCLTWYKSMIPLTGPMWADPMLADLDKALFGRDPGPAIQEPLRFLDLTIDRMYALWALVVKLMFLCLLAETPGLNRATLLLAFFLTVGLLGSWGQFVLPSGGPIYWENLGLGDRFASIVPLPAVQIGKDYLWAAYQGQGVGFASGISAMPSIHVATTTWMLLATIKQFRAARLPTAVIFALVAVGSVYTGWHYVVDGVAGAFGAVGCYWLAAFIVDRTPDSWLGQAQPAELFEPIPPTDLRRRPASHR